MEQNDTPRTDAAKSYWDSAERENCVSIVLARELERELAASQAEVEFYKKSVKAYVHACEPIRGMADKLGLRLGECIIQHGVPLLLDSHKKAVAEVDEQTNEVARLRAEVQRAIEDRNRIGIEIRGEYLPKLKETTNEVARLRDENKKLRELMRRSIDLTDKILEELPPPFPFEWFVDLSEKASAIDEKYSYLLK